MQIGSQHSWLWFQTSRWMVTLMVGRHYFQIGRWQPDLSKGNFPDLNRLGFVCHQYRKYLGPPGHMFKDRPVLQKPEWVSYYGHSRLFGYYYLETWKKGR